jgi:hypothetical protein
VWDGDEADVAAAPGVARLCKSFTEARQRPRRGEQRGKRRQVRDALAATLAGGWTLRATGAPSGGGRSRAGGCRSLGRGFR